MDRKEAVWNKGSYGVGLAIDDVEANLPFEIKGFDCDNGSEFLNYHLINKFAERPKEKAIQFTRSRLMWSLILSLFPNTVAKVRVIKFITSTYKSRNKLTLTFVNGHCHDTSRLHRAEFIYQNLMLQTL